MSRRFTWKTLSCLVAMLVLGAGHASAAVISTFNNLAGWQAAAGPESWVVDFSAFAVDTGFQAAVDAGPFSLDEVGGQGFRNFIDVSPFSFGDNNGTTHASMFTDFTSTTVNMVFDSPVRAFGADFFDALSGERLDFLLNFVGGGSQVVQLGNNGFFGLTSDTAISSITFQSRVSDGSTGGEGFGLDNVRGVAVPEPATLLLFSTAGVALVRRLRQRRA